MQLIKQAGTIDPGYCRIELKMAGFGLFSRRGLSDYAVTEISQYVWWRSPTRRYGQKVHKLTLHGGFSCPNRDGTIGRGGCTFCNVAWFADEAQQHRSIAEQLAHQANLVNRAKRYLAYFQAYTEHLCGSSGAAFYVSAGGEPGQYCRFVCWYPPGLRAGCGAGSALRI